MPRRDKQLPSNPFHPTFGKLPPELIDNDRYVKQLIRGLHDGSGSPDRFFRIFGPRCSGKTSLLKAMGDAARAEGWHVVNVAAENGNDVPMRIIKKLHTDSTVSETHGVMAAIGNIVNGDGNTSSVSLSASGSKTTTKSSTIDSIDLTTSFEEFFACNRKIGGILLLIDEAQNVDGGDMAKILSTMQELNIDGYDIAFAIAGFPSLKRLIGSGRGGTSFITKTRRVELGRLNPVSVTESFMRVFHQYGISIGEDTAKYMSYLAQGYPVLIQCVGHSVYRLVERQEQSRRSADNVNMVVARDIVNDEYAAFLLQDIIEDMTPMQIRFMIDFSALANEDQNGIVRWGDLLERTGSAKNALTPPRAQLIDAGVIEARHRGQLICCIPYLTQYIAGNADQLRLEYDDEMPWGDNGYDYSDFDDTLF